MQNVKLVIHEAYQGDRKIEEAFAAVFLSDIATHTIHKNTFQLANRSLGSIQLMEGSFYGNGKMR